MTWFMIRMEGEGLEAEIAGDLPIFFGIFKVKKKLSVAGFYATRYVNAEDAETAVALVSSSIMSDLAKELPSSQKSLSNFVLRVDEIATVNSEEVDLNARGFAFF